MRRTEVGATRADNDAFDDTPAILRASISASFFVSLMIVLEITFLSLDVAIIRHRISAEIEALPQCFFHCLKHGFQVSLRDFVGVREGVDSDAPENLIRVDIADTGNQTLVHQHLFYLSPRLFLYLEIEIWKFKIFIQGFRSQVFEMETFLKLICFY